MTSLTQPSDSIKGATPRTGLGSGSSFSYTVHFQQIFEKALASVVGRGTNNGSQFQEGEMLLLGCWSDRIKAWEHGLTNPLQLQLYIRRNNPMASLFSHAIAAFAIGKTFKRHEAVKFFLLGMLCAVLPDADVLSFQFGIPYGSMFGHRGFTHSIVFAILLALVMTSLFYRKEKRFTGPWVGLFIYLFLCTLSHGLLDALTDGGMGVAFFSPFSNERYFFPFRPVRVSPIDAGRFFTARGWVILKSELIWIWIPSLALILVTATLRAVFKRSQK